ncbi:MAG: thioredoxin family protein [Rubrivivax sp.]|jgi:thiol-disulfide isomerase/thioredoxin
MTSMASTPSWPRLLLAAALTLTSAAGLHAAPQAASAKPAAAPSSQVAWLSARDPGDVDAAMARAKAARQPLLLYWGATWCPPCNRLKAQLFNRQDFAALTRGLVALHVDGDRPAAQKISARFGVSGYPTLLLLSSDGQELTRIPGEVEPEQVLPLLQLGLAGGRGVRAVLADARADKPLSAGDWRLLAFFSWETDASDEQRILVPKAERSALLARLAARADSQPVAGAEVATRLWLKAIAARGEGDVAKAGWTPDATLTARVEKLLADPVQSRLHASVLTSEAADLLKGLGVEDNPGVPLAVAMDAALTRLQSDPGFARADRMDALIARLALARRGQAKDVLQPQLPEPLVRGALDQVARDDREIRDGHERQAVITAAAYALGQAGRWAESDTLLKSNLARSHSPYYLMSQLGSNARKQGRTAEALDWYAQSYDKAVGPATRLQWGNGFLTALVDLAPKDTSRIDQTAQRLLADAATDGAAFEGRSGRSLQRANTKLVAWSSSAPEAAAAVQRWHSRLAAMCTQLPAREADQRQACQALVKPAAPTAAAVPAPTKG